MKILVMGLPGSGKTYLCKQISQKYSLPPIKVADPHKGGRKRSAKRKTPIWNSSSPIPKVTNPKRSARKDVTPEKSNVAENSFVAKTKSIFGQFIQKVVKNQGLSTQGWDPLNTIAYQHG